MKEEQGSRLIEVRIAGELAASMLATGYTTGANRVTCVEGLPEGAKLVDASVDGRGNLKLLFEHEMFAPVQPGTMFPSLIPVYRQDSR